jgi:hypothetical protein
MAMIPTWTEEVCHVSPNSSFILLVEVPFISLSLEVFFFLFLCFFASSFYLSHLNCQLAVFKLREVVPGVVAYCNKRKALYLKFLIFRAIRV